MPDILGHELHRIWVDPGEEARSLCSWRGITTRFMDAVRRSNTRNFSRGGKLFARTPACLAPSALLRVGNSSLIVTEARDRRPPHAGPRTPASLDPERRPRDDGERLPGAYDATSPGGNPASIASGRTSASIRNPVRTGRQAPSRPSIRSRSTPSRVSKLRGLHRARREASIDDHAGRRRCPHPQRDRIEDPDPIPDAGARTSVRRSEIIEANRFSAVEGAKLVVVHERLRPPPGNPQRGPHREICGDAATVFSGTPENGRR